MAMNAEITLAKLHISKAESENRVSARHSHWNMGHSDSSERNCILCIHSPAGDLEMEKKTLRYSIVGAMKIDVWADVQPLDQVWRVACQKRNMKCQSKM